MSDFTGNFYKIWWLKAWCTAIAGGNSVSKATEYAERCLEEFKKRFEQEKVDER